MIEIYQGLIGTGQSFMQKIFIRAPVTYNLRIPRQITNTKN